MVPELSLDLLHIRIIFTEHHFVCDKSRVPSFYLSPDRARGVVASRARGSSVLVLDRMLSLLIK